jgi:excisionase family DNA binding protein
VTDRLVTARELAEPLLDVLRPLVTELVAEEVERRLDELDGGRSKEWYTLAEAGARLGCSRDAVRMRAKRGRLEARRMGRNVYVSARSVDGLR